MRTLPLFALTLAIPCAALAAPQTETRTLPEFHKVDASAGLTLEIVPGAPGVTLTGEKADLERVVAEVVDGTLRLHRKDPRWNGKSVKVKLSSPPLDALDVSGGVELKVDGAVARPKFALDLSGGVDATITGLKTDSLQLDASGGVKARLSGEAGTGRLELSGGVDLQAKELRFGTVSLDASGGCDAELSAKDTVTGDASAGVSVLIHGRPKARVSASVGAEVRVVD